MRLTRIQRLVAPASLLLLASLVVEAAPAESVVTVTIVSDQLVTVVQTAAPVTVQGAAVTVPGSAVTVIQSATPVTVVQQSVRTVTAPAVPQTPVPQTPAPAPTTGPGPAATGNVFFTIAVQQAALANFANNLIANPGKAQDVFTITPDTTNGIITIETPSNATAAAVTNATDPAAPPAAAPAATPAADATLAGAPARIGKWVDLTDPTTGSFPGGNPPNREVDLPLSIIFGFLFAGGAAVHITTLRRNSKRGHKFLIQDLLFDFCMVRVLSCIFRIIFIFKQVRGVIIFGEVFLNGG